MSLYLQTIGFMYAIEHPNYSVQLTTTTALQITVGHRTMADQNLPMTDEIPTVVGHDVRTIFLPSNQCKR